MLDIITIVVFIGASVVFIRHLKSDQPGWFNSLGKTGWREKVFLWLRKTSKIIWRASLRWPFPGVIVWGILFVIIFDVFSDTDVQEAVVRFEKSGPVIVFDLPLNLKHPRIELMQSVSANVEKGVVGFRFDGTLYEFTTEGSRGFNRAMNNICKTLLDKPWHRESDINAHKYNIKRNMGTAKLWRGSELEWNSSPYIIRVFTYSNEPISFSSIAIKYKIVDQEAIGL